MEKLSRVSMGMFVVFLVLPPWAHALEVGLARLQDGEVRVMGKGAEKDASVYWQDVAVTTSTGGGSFQFTSASIPMTCVGKLSDGVTSLFIAVSGCTASGVTVPSPDPRFTDNLDGTITDNLTGLIWLKNGDCYGLTPWLGALAAVDRLQDGLCGLTDGSVAGSWRLPNRNELLSLLYEGSGLPTGHPFIKPEEPQRYYWSSTTYPFIPSTAWIVRIFQDGYQDRSVKADTNLVIAVRGGF